MNQLSSKDLFHAFYEKSPDKFKKFIRSQGVRQFLDHRYFKLCVAPEIIDLLTDIGIDARKLKYNRIKFEIPTTTINTDVWIKWSDLGWTKYDFITLKIRSEMDQLDPKGIIFHNYRFDLKTAKGSKKECIICYYDYDWKYDYIVLLPCRHFYHEGCIEEWHKKSNKCPVCRETFDSYQ